MPPRRIKFTRTDIWREGMWVDLWSVVHFISGMSVALVLSRFHVALILTTLVAVALLIAYEFWEAHEQIEETLQNRVMDVVVGSAGFALIYATGLSVLDTRTFILFASFVIGFNIIFATFGWYASQKAAVLEERIKLRVAERRKRFIEQRTRLAERWRRQGKHPLV